ncbi:MAG TPA: CHASE2 domain-containing protein [Fibrobacteraceae bacterium]|nr:CHASE2 domain-containing protein [Fibrobacteraceae bacterium]
MFQFEVTKRFGLGLGKNYFEAIRWTTFSLEPSPALTKLQYMVKKRLSKALKKMAAGLLAGVAMGFLVFAASHMNGALPRYIERLERVFYDLSFKFNYVYNIDQWIAQPDSGVQADSTSEPRIEVVDIDERALSKLGSYNTWPRTHHADVVRYLTEGGASSITFDILFKTADFGKRDAENALEVMRKVYPRENWDRHFPAIRSAYNHDSVLVQAVHDAGNVVVCATMTERRNYEYKTQWEPLSTRAWQDSIGTGGTLDPGQIPLATVTVWDLLDNIFPDLAHATPYLGLVNVIPDDDGVHRKEPLFHAFPNPELASGSTPRYYPLITIQTVAMLFGISPREIIVRPGEYVDMGQPLGIGKDSSGALYTTYPHLTWPMLGALLAKRQEVLELSSGKSKNRLLEIAHQVVVNRDSSGALTADVNDAQTLTPAMLRAILETPRFDSLMTLAHENLVSLGGGVFMDPDSESGLVRMTDSSADEEAFLTLYGVQTLRDGHDKIASLPPGKTLFLSCNLDLRYDLAKKKLESNFIILNPSVIRDLLAMPLVELENMPRGALQRFGDRVRIPVDDQLRMQVNYIGLYDVKRSNRSFQQISYYDMVRHRVDPGSFQGKVFLLGSTAPALFDLVSAPHEAVFPGVLIHATILENILNGNFLHIMDERTQMILILGLALICALLASILTPALGLLALLFCGIGYFLVGLHYFEQGLYLGMARQVLTIVLSFIVIMVIRFLFENREKRFLDKTFKQYISPELIDIMVESEQKPSLGGQESYATAFFTDIAGFSSFSEAIGSPAKLVELLNEYLGNMTTILTQDHGTLDKYIGDAIVAVFGAPVEIPDHAQRASLVALKMQKRLLELRERWRDEKKWPELVPQMHMRIGINTGKMVVGNMGSAFRMNYTMMGDAVNLAARLESASKHYGVYIQVSDETLRNLKPGSVLSRPIDLIVVMGKTEPVLCHELLALHEDVTEDLRTLVNLWEQARAAYLAMRWDEAIVLFRQCLGYEPHHPDRDPGAKTTPSHLFMQRCELYKQNPPVPIGLVWNGVYTATSK